MIGHSRGIKVFTGNSNPQLAKDICKHLGIPLGTCEVGSFADGENFASVYETVRGADVFVVQSTCSFDVKDADGKIIVNTQQINPMPVIIGAAQYPENLLDKMGAAGLDVDALDALSLAEQAGSSKAVNIVLMGHLSRYFDFTEEEWLNALTESVAPKFLEMNKKAFALGRNA